MLLKNKTALITGSNRGIGYSILKNFAKEGANIIAHSRKENHSFSKKIINLKKKYNINIINIYFDLNDSNSIKNSILNILKKKEPIDILVNSAGIIHGGLFQMTKISDIKKVYDINFFSMLEITQIISKYMIRYKRGSIINISSVAGIDLSSGNCAYGTSKASIIAFSKVLSDELKKFNIRVNTIAPSLTDTDMGNSIEAEKERNCLNNSNDPFKRLLKPCEIADLATYLGSDKSSFINRQIIRIDGGNKF